MTKHYLNSKGQHVEISTMAYPHLKAALAKLEAGGIDDERAKEIQAMRAEVQARDDVYRAEREGMA